MDWCKCSWKWLTMYSKDGVVCKALTLIGKLQNKYGFKSKFYNLASPCPSPDRELPTIYEEDSGFTEQDWVGDNICMRLLFPCNRLYCVVRKSYIARYDGIFWFKLRLIIKMLLYLYLFNIANWK